MVNPEDFGGVKVSAPTGVRPEDFGGVPARRAADTIGPKDIPGEKFTAGNVAPPAKDQAPSAGPLVGGLETIASVGSGLGASVLGAGAGLAGGVRRLVTGDTSGPSPNEVATGVMKDFTYRPRFKEGQDIVGQIGGFLDSTKLAGMGPGESAALGGVARPTVSFPQMGGKPKVAAPAASAAPSGGAERVTSYLQGIRDTIESKVGRKVERAETQAGRTVADAEAQGAGIVGAAERRLEDARAAPRGETTATPGEFGATARAAAEARKVELEGLRDQEKLLLFDALDSGAKVNITGIPKQIDLMLANEKNPDIVNALAKAKRTLLSKEEATKLDKIDLKTPEGRSQLQQALSEASGKSEKWDSSMKGLDSARLAIKSMMSGRGSDPADQFAKSQLMQVVGMLESAMGKASPEYGQFLERWAEKSRGLDPFSARTGAGARTAGALKKDSFGGDFMTSPESMGARFFRPGDEGAAAAREFKTATNANPEAMRSLGAYVQGKLKDTPPDKWGPFLKRHESALKEYGLYDNLNAQQQAASQAAEGVGAAQASAKSGVGAAKERAKAVIGGAADTEKNVSRSLKESALGRVTSNAAAYRRLTGGDAQAAMETVFAGERPERNLQQLVSATRKDPKAAEGLRQSFKEWLAPPGGEAKEAIARWDHSRAAVERSGMFGKPHVESIDKIMKDVASAETADVASRAVATTAGWLVGLPFGRPGSTAMIARNLSSFASKRASQRLDQALHLAVDPQRAAVLAAPPTPQNISKVQSWLGREFVEDMGPAATVAPVEAREQNTRRRDLFGMQPAGL